MSREDNNLYSPPVVEESTGSHTGGQQRDPRRIYLAKAPGPQTTVLLTLLGLAYTAALIAHWAGAGTLSFQYFGLLPGAVERGEVWRILSWFWLHGSLTHFLWNIAWIHFFGSEVEQALARKGLFAGSFIAFGVVSGVFVVALAWAGFLPEAVYVGNSSWLFGLMVFYTLLEPRRYVLLPFLQLRFVTPLLVAWSLLGSQTSLVALGSLLGGLCFFLHRRAKKQTEHGQEHKQET